MLHEFLLAHRDEIVRRCQAKAALRSAPPAALTGMEEGVPLFIGQLVAALRYEEENPAQRREGNFRFSASMPAQAESSRAAAMHGEELHKAGYTVDQVVHDYGDICQALTELAKDENADVTLDEFRTLNRLLDDAIADAVTSFGRHRDELVRSHGDRELHDKIGTLADEQRRLVDRSLQALEALKVGNIGLMGATGSMLEDSLRALRDLIDRSLPEIRLSSGMTAPPKA